MALNRQSLSPTANLLRNSRLFSLPTPLPRPPVAETYGAGMIKASDTATLPYPTHQAIVTTKASLARGDWGLKRPLPSRSHLVQVSEPVLRVTHLDTIEHITDFDSAADHVRTRQKWEEMGVPMMKGLPQMRDHGLSSVAPAGAFELRDDTTSYDEELGLDEAGLYLKALEDSMAAERAERDVSSAVRKEWEAFNATWTEKWNARQATWREQGWTDRTQFQAARREALNSEMDAFRASWDQKWAARKKEWQALGNPDHPDRVAGVKALRKEMDEAQAALKQRWEKKTASLSASMPWWGQFQAFQRQHEKAKQALRKQLSASTPSASTSTSTSFTPFKRPPVDADVHNIRRWKHEGPWLPGMSADEFVTYLSKQIASRKEEFKAYLVTYVKNDIYNKRRRDASQAQEAPPMDAQEAERWQDEREKAWRNISSTDLAAGIKALREETAVDPLNSQLVTELILPFLKLPAIKFKFRLYDQDASNRDVDQYTFDQDKTPLSTHPSAGLGYLRTRAYLTNHPILGPQERPTPIPARVVQARRTSTREEAYARLGVAGFIANDQFRSSESIGLSYNNSARAKDVETIDVDTPGGRKVYVQPLFAAVTNEGRIHIKLKRSIGPEIAVARGDLDDRVPDLEPVEKDPLADLGSAKSGVWELDELSGQAQQLSSFLRSQSSPGKAQPPVGFPGVADALRGE
ncbi:hypothetical protein BDW02DRAFT_573221 [Decorospora gaudefroyi]|uniref:Uncharacterized protein n=1 Tax=Decorospora gaudefroyi TaxID=184978 RepID=A0A6A5K1S6_9PLEO|nr:hypothetical protein BDW02DRAFT_573221 [Decorospora gaudefroyi]